MMKNYALGEGFAERLLAWYDAGHRDLPWRHTRDPYRIWISEIMLQQTQAKTVVPYYERFLSRFPAVRDLADAPETDVLKLWEGLGYYSRARNLQRAARIVCERFGGSMPRTAAELETLPGIGAYTAGAVASIAYGEAVPAVDGNVERAVSRVCALREVVSLPAVRKRIRDCVAGAVPKDRAGDFTNAMMELGSCVCTPKKPACESCPVKALCEGYREGICESLPVKAPRAEKKTEAREVLLIFCRGRVLLIRRSEALLGGLYAFPCAEGLQSEEMICNYADGFGLTCAYDGCLGTARHVFTHLIWNMTLHALAVPEMPTVAEGVWADAAMLEALPLPTAFAAARKAAMDRLTGRERRDEVVL